MRLQYKPYLNNISLFYYKNNFQSIYTYCFIQCFMNMTALYEKMHPGDHYILWFNYEPHST